MPKAWTPAELADALEATRLDPDNTDRLSMLDREAFAFDGTSTEIAEAHLAFSRALIVRRSAGNPAGHGFSDADWWHAVDTARHLGTLLRALDK